MSNQSIIFTCSKCGAQFLKWQGRCSECGAWGTVAEEQKPRGDSGKNEKSVYLNNAQVIDLANIRGEKAQRVETGIGEIDRVLGGGIVPGSLILLGGEPGIGKSTLVLQMAERLGEKKKLRNSPCEIKQTISRGKEIEKLEESWKEAKEGDEGKDKLEIRNCLPAEATYCAEVVTKIESAQAGKLGGEKIPLSAKTADENPPLEKGENNVVLYASGEESAEQIKLRMDRLGIKGENIKFLSETNVESICGAIQKYKPALAIVDSIQMLYSSDVDSECGSVNQIRASAAKLMGVAKTPPPAPPCKWGEVRASLPPNQRAGKSGTGLNTLNGAVGESETESSLEKSPPTPLWERWELKNPAIIIIGHITKDGAVAGPKTLEHLVDTVLYLEGERFHTYRILRAVKNRFGSTNEIGIFEMHGNGLREVKNPSALFMEEHNENLPGRVVACIIEGTRPFLIEIQALTTTTNFGYPQRKVSGYDLNRLQLLLAVLQKRLGLNFSNKDVYLNVVGGFKIQEPSADLAVCLALISVLKNQPLSAGTAAFGEVGLGGEIRAVSQTEKRINEATKLGFKNIICPKGKKSEKRGNVEAGTLQEAVGKIFEE